MPGPVKSTKASQVLGLFASELDLIVTSENLIEELPIDSLDWISFRNSVEDETGVEIPNHINFETVGDLLRWVEAP